MTQDAVDAARWQAFLAKDAAAEGQFVVAVRTTGIFCRPTCSARPKRENLHFLPDARAALRAGFRACKRCRPPLEEIPPVSA